MRLRGGRWLGACMQAELGQQADTAAAAAHVSRCPTCPTPACRGPQEADELLARAGFVKNADYRWGSEGGAGSAAFDSMDGPDGGAAADRPRL